ncbi:MAG: Flagellar hook-associated protein 1 [Pseudomonadota bacterium]|jgi:flagellar hook-associated protein FlgK
MSDMLGISSGAIGAYQRALTTVSNNIANVNTEGYSRQDVVLTDSAPKKMASMYVGTGVMLQTIKRQFDAFAESNLRNSASDLASQKPMVDYTKRVMDIMGDKSIGLSSALDTFFAAAGSLSADPASSVLRTSLMTSADGVASRFGELATQMDLISTETRQGLEGVANQVNTLTDQLALINQSMTKSPTLEGQPAELLDRRDLTLRKLSDLVRTKVTFSSNGSVTVSLGNTMTQGLVVNGIKARPVGINSAVKDKVELVLDPYGKTESLASVSGGQIGGYLNFIGQVLEPAQKNLSALAHTFATETNAIQKNGIDGYGQMGQDLFAFDPAAASEAHGIRLALNDGMRIATAAQFRVSEGNTNVTTTRASVKFMGQTPTTALSNSKLVNNPNKTAAVTFKVDGANVYTPVTNLSAGVKATFYLDQAAPGQELQVMTRDGRQLLGRALSETEKYQLFTPANGFAANANYSDAYLNQTGSKAYRGIDMFYGAKASVLQGQNFDQYGAAGPAIPLAASMDTERISSADFKVAADAITLNGIALPEFNGENASAITIFDVNVGTPSSTSFTFHALVAGQDIDVPVAPTSDLKALAASLNASFQLQPKSRSLHAAVDPNGADLHITDANGRDISGVTFAASTTTTGASVGAINVSSPAVQVANWINGTSQAEIVNAQFDLASTPSFSKFQATVGGVHFDLDASTANDLPTLASNLQLAFRTKDKTSAISVVVDGTSLKITDTLGRSFKDFQLQVADATSAAKAGTANITNSNVSQTNVRAEVFSEIRVPVTQINISKKLQINGHAIADAKTVTDLVDKINNSGAGVVASIEPNGELVITDPLGSPITIDPTTDGNSINIQPATYGGQVRMVQVVRDMVISATDVDLKKPLQINGVNLVMSQSAYELPLSSVGNYSIEYSGQSVSGATPEALADALNQDTNFSAQFKATFSGTRLILVPKDGTLSDADVANQFVVKSGNGELLKSQAKKLADLVGRINASSEDSTSPDYTGVVATLDIHGDLQLSTVDPKGMGSISIGPGKDAKGAYEPNALGLEPADFDVTARLKRKLLDPDFNTDIRMTFGASGTPSDLSNIGLRTGAYIQNGCPDDLLLFVTGKGAANVSVGYQGQPDNVRDSLRSQSLSVKFTAADRYSIIDTKTGTELADRHYDPSVLEPMIEFEGLQIKLSHAPSVGDSYKIDGNYDGLGNNVNMLDMVDLNKKPVTNGKTIANTYIDQINSVGNLAQQANITQQALTVVNDQAIAARDKVSGVNLDEEAASLIRYQQAYQACAKVMQTSGQLFDAIIQIR